MAFNLYSTSDGRVPAVEYLPASEMTPKAGMALYLKDGMLSIATGTTVPTYLCMTEKDSAVSAGTLIPVIRIESDMIFRTTNSAALTSEIGSKVTLHATNGMQVTATVEGGVAEIVYKSGNEVGSEVRVRF